MIQGELEGDAAAHREADDVGRFDVQTFGRGALDVEAVEEVAEVGGVVLVRVAVGRDHAAAVAADVVAYDAKAGVDEGGDLGVPEAEVAAVAVDEDDGRAFAGVFVEGDDAVGVGVGHG